MTEQLTQYTGQTLAYRSKAAGQGIGDISCVNKGPLLATIQGMTWIKKPT